MNKYTRIHIIAIYIILAFLICIIYLEFSNTKVPDGYHLLFIANDSQVLQVKLDEHYFNNDPNDHVYILVCKKRKK